MDATVLRIALVLVGIADSSLAFAQSSSAPSLDPSGYYLPVSTTASFRNLKWVELWAEKGKSAGFKGSMRFSTGESPDQFQNWGLRSVTLTGNDLGFQSVEAAGNRFRFAGHFLKAGRFAELQPTGVVLRGRLVQLSKHKVVAQEDLEFRYYVGH